MDELPLNAWGESLRDTILDNSALRDGLLDDEAEPLIAWGLAVATQVTAPLDDMAEARYEELYEALPKLLNRLTWVVLHRENKGSDWTLRILGQLNELNQILWGEDAAQISDEQMQIYATQADGLNHGDLVLDLMQKLSPNPNEGDMT